MDRALMMDSSGGATPKTGVVNKFVVYARKVYHPLGFHKGYNFPLFIITCGAMWGFFFARAQYLNIDGIFVKNTLPGELYYYGSGHGRVGIIMHLVTILPVTFLVVFQFIPIIRYKALLFHRLNGYLCILLMFVSNAGAFMIVRHAVGGSIQTQLWLGMIGTLTTAALILAWVNIKALQIDQHRAWMLRAWVWAASIISLRLIRLAANKVITNWLTFWTAMPCGQIFFMYKTLAGLPDAQNPTNRLYPSCSISPETNVAVSTRPTGRGGPENIAALSHMTFGMAGWLALSIHVILLETYLALTPAESARLRMVSYERQVQAGFRKPHLGGLTASRLGDAPPTWNSPLMQEKFGSTESNARTLHPSETEIAPRQKDDIVGGSV